MFCIRKDSINKMKNQLTEWENIFANRIANNELTSKIYKEFTKLNIKKTLNNPIKNI